MKLRLLVLSILLIALSSFMFAAATSDVSREWAPVQNGFVKAGENVLPYAPDRIMVKFTEQAMENLKLDTEFGMDRVSPFGDVETGIASVDALGRQFGVTKVSRATIEPKNTVEADRLGVDRWHRIDLPRGANIMDVVGRYADDPNVEYASPDWRAFPAAVPNDPLHADHWGHNNTAQLPDLDWGGTYDHTLPTTVGTPGFDANAHGAWDVTYGSSSVVIAILDSGVDIDHPDLRLVAGYDYGDNDSNPDDNSAQPGHGTCCAGVAASIANNGIGAEGIAAGCSVMPLKVANSAGSLYFSAIVNAIYHAADNGADVISMSFSADISSDPSTDAAIQYAYNAGVVLLAATSNYNQSHIHYPANNQYVVGVGAASPCGGRKRSSSLSYECNPGVSTDPNGYTCDGERWWGSNYGTTTPDAAGAVDIIAPTILPTTDIQGSGGYRSGDYEPFFNGTSCATPYAAGVCALIKSVNPTWTGAQVRDQLCNTAIDIVNVESGSGWDRYSGYGMVDAEAAVGGGGPVAPTADFSATPTSGDAPLTVTFTDLSSGEPTSWSWDFGDTGTSGEQNPVHTYDNPGTYTVSLTATNAQGSDDEVKTGYITVTEPGVTTFVTAASETPVAGTVGGSVVDTRVSDDSRETITEVLSDSHPRKTYSYLEHNWHFTLPSGGNVTFHLEASRTSGGDGDDFAFEYSTDGVNWSPLVTVAGTSETTYSAAIGAVSGSVTVRATDTERSWGGTALDELSVDYMAFEVGDAQPQPPVAAFSGSPTSGEYPLDVTFTDMSTGNPTSWVWDFGDGVGGSTEQNPVYTYTAAGAYTVTLTATNDYGSDDEIKVGYITVTEPGSASFVTAEGESPVTGTVTGDYLDTQASDDIRETITEVLYTGHPRKTYSYLEHQWAFTLPTGGDVTFHLEASRTSGGDGDDFVFEYSTDGVSWIPMVTVSGTSETNYNAALGPLSGSVTVRATDTERAWGGSALDALSIDYMAFEIAGAGGRITLDHQSETPPQNALVQNYPNPFNPRTTISYVLARETSVTLEIFDVAGKRVATLVNGREGIGEHVVEFDASSFSSGVYFYRLVAGDFTEMKKMVLLK